MADTSSVWNHIAIIITNCYQGYKNKDIKKKYTKYVQDLYKLKYPTNPNIPSVPCFLVDSKDYRDPETQAELNSLFFWIT